MNRFLSFLLALCFALSISAEKQFLNLTPRPKTTLSYDGSCPLPTTFAVGVSPALGDTAVAEAQRFVDMLNRTMTGHTVTLTRNTSEALFRVHPYTGAYSNVGAEGYRLTIKADTIGVAAATRLGYYYAFTSLLKMLPANVTYGVPGDASAHYSLPIVTITDQPRFAFRSFMLDCSRHFFSVEEIKRMLDIMAIYKMNVFHWHLTDDQGWRAEVKKYPKLTQVGATRAKNRTTPIHMVDDYWWTGEGYMDNKTYGPFYYTQDEMRDIVAYAAERHIEVMPEIEMPGHAVAAMVAYPEYSCDPTAKREVKTDGGIYNDVMNVANPATMQFLYDVIDEMCDIFPGRYFHIGGDECPVDKWRTNALCQQFKKDHSLVSDREIQSYFINQISKYLASKGKRTVVWNESITANHETDGKANTTLVKEHNPVIMCWIGSASAAAQAASLDLDAIITEYHSNAPGESGKGGYYINRRQSADYGEPSGAGDGDDTVEGCYNYVPVPANVTAANERHYLGVQGTFWTEHVDSDEYLEYLALPRLICMAETGWSTQSRKNWKDFVDRMVLDTEILDLGGYIYGRHWMPGYKHRVFVNPIADGAIMQFINKSDDRGDRCMADNGGTLLCMAPACTNFILESTGKAGEYYIRSEVSGKYLYAAKVESGAQVTLDTRKTAWTFDEKTIAGYVAICTAANDKLAINNKADNYNTKARLFAHESGNGASFWKTELIGNTPVVSPVISADNDASFYDLSGQRVVRSAAGQLLINGQRKQIRRDAR